MIDIQGQYQKALFFIRKLFSFWFLISSIIIASLMIICESFGIIDQKYTIYATSFLVGTILIYLITERASVLEDIHASILRNSHAEYCDTSEITYMKVTQIISQVSLVGRANSKKILHAGFHGYRGQYLSRTDESRKRRKILWEMFDKEILKCINSSGHGSWSVRSIFNITSEKRLNEIVDLLNNCTNAEGFEVKTFFNKNYLPMFSPLVIGNEDVFLAREHPVFSRVNDAIHLHGKEYVKMATEYYESLWSDSEIIVIRSATGINEDNIENLRTKLKGH